MLNAVPKQFSLNESGYITYQPVLNDPRPGEVVAALTKGAHALEPEIEIGEAASLEGQDKDAVRQHLSYWLRSHIETVLQPLVALKEAATQEGPVAGIAAKVYEAMGTIPRAELEEFTTQLDADMRREIRSKGITLGPLLVFMREMNKPAAMKLRGILWSIANNTPLPFAMPKDGAVSFGVDPKTINHDLYRTIGYPVYGTRAVRIDMLDRVVTAIYDSAEKGQFQAQHQMAEWLGCPIAELYAILEAMGHTKIKDPAEEAQATEENKNETDEIKEGESSEVEAEQGKRDPQAKPELATFRLKRGKAHLKPQKKEPAKKTEDRKPKMVKRKKEKPKQGPKDKGPKIISTGPEKKAEDSPFAILQQLKQKDG